MNTVDPSSVLARPMIGRVTGVTWTPGVLPPMRTVAHGGAVAPAATVAPGGHVARPRNATSRAGVGGRSGAIGAPVANGSVGLRVSPVGAVRRADFPRAGSFARMTIRPPPQSGKPWSAQTTPGAAIDGSQVRTPRSAQSEASAAVTPSMNLPAGAVAPEASRRSAGLSASDRNGRARRGESAGSLAGNRRVTVQAGMGPAPSAGAHPPGEQAGMSGIETSTAPSPVAP